MSQLADIAKEESKLEMTPMIDVTFLLLIFFMCTLKFKSLEGKLAAYLPKDVGVNSSDAEPIEKVEIVCKVLKEGRRVEPRKDKSEPAVEWDGVAGTRYEYEGREMIYGIGPKITTDLEEIARTLKRIHENDPERPATIDARKGTVYADVVGLLDAAMNANFTDVTFVGSYE